MKSTPPMNPLYRLWLRFGRLKPILTPHLALAPTSPAGEAREPVSDQDGAYTRAMVARRREVMDQLCQVANAFVYRDYGCGRWIEHDAPPPTIDESTQLEIDRVAAEQ